MTTLRHFTPRWSAVRGLYRCLPLALVGLVAAQRVVWCADSNLRLRETRLHQVYGVASDSKPYRKMDRASLEGERGLAHSTFIERRWTDDSGTRKYEYKFLLLTTSGIRVTDTLEADYFTCRSTERIEVRWDVDRREYLDIHEPLGRCPDYTEESNTQWRKERVAKGWEPLPQFHSVTLETATIRTTIERDEWLKKGNKQILDTLSGEFAAVATGDIATAAQMNGLARLTCEQLAGLYSLECEGVSQTHGSAKTRHIDCDFDASFDEPCTADEQREFDGLRSGTSLNALPTPPPEP